MTGFPHLDEADLDGATNVLLVAPEFCQSVESLFSELLLSGDSPPSNVVGVTTSKSPLEFLDPWRRSLPSEETSFSFVSADGLSRSVAADAGGASGGHPVASNVTYVDDLTPVDEFGQTIADELRPDEAGDTAVCFHSVTDLLEYVDEETAFDFLHAVLSRVRRNGARGIYHIDASVHDEKTLVTLSTLFDLVVQFDGDSAGGG